MYDGKQNIERTKQLICEAEALLKDTEIRICEGDDWLYIQADSLRRHIAQLCEQIAGEPYE